MQLLVILVVVDTMYVLISGTIGTSGTEKGQTQGVTSTSKINVAKTPILDTRLMRVQKVLTMQIKNQAKAQGKR